MAPDLPLLGVFNGEKRSVLSVGFDLLGSLATEPCNLVQYLGDVDIRMLLMEVFLELVVAMPFEIAPIAQAKCVLISVVSRKATFLFIMPSAMTPVAVFRSPAFLTCSQGRFRWLCGETFSRYQGLLGRFSRYCLFLTLRNGLRVESEEGLLCQQVKSRVSARVLRAVAERSIH